MALGAVPILDSSGNLLACYPCGFVTFAYNCLMKANNLYKRAAKAIDGADEAVSPRSHAEEPAGDKAKKANPQRMDILRRAAISNRQNDVSNT
jgi:hypothetical protein